MKRWLPSINLLNAPPEPKRIVAEPKSAPRKKSAPPQKKTKPEGDRSENAEYIYGRKRLRELDKRLRYLGKLLKDIALVDPERVDSSKVCFGATVELLDEKGQERVYTIVGEGEVDVVVNGISYLSPMARALMGKAAGDYALVHRPAGELELEVIAVYSRPVAIK